MSEDLEGLVPITEPAVVELEELREVVGASGQRAAALDDERPPPRRRRGGA